MKNKIWTVEKRKEKIESVKKMLKNLGRIEYKKAVSVVCLNTGNRKEKVKEYFDVLEDYGSIKIEGGFIEYIGKD